MPIYAYKCGSCGHQQDVLQKLSDPVLTDCPACGAATFAKQITAAGFQLKGSGWYQTDFRNGGSAPPAAPDAAKADSAAQPQAAACPACPGASGGCSTAAAPAAAATGTTPAA
jgi:putative FmdB family regulatory protein